VVRLKTGDPLIFGRGGEEIEALRKAGIRFEIVPGVTTGLAAAAAAQIPLTHRDLSHALVFLTGNSAAGRKADWKTLVASGATLAIYMPGSNYDALARRLIDAGIQPETPCAVISAASTREQKILVGTVATVPDNRHLPTPSLFIVGEVVRFAQAFNDSHLHLPGELNGKLSAPMPEMSQLMADEEIA
jgi:siroheme synthase